MDIGEQVARMVARRVPRIPANPDGGIGGLTDDEETQLCELLNEGYPCECGVCGCNSPLIEPRFR